jgi:hypothetical protein
MKQFQTEANIISHWTWTINQSSRLQDSLSMNWGRERKSRHKCSLQHFAFKLWSEVGTWVATINVLWIGLFCPLVFYCDRREITKFTIIVSILFTDCGPPGIILNIDVLSTHIYTWTDRNTCTHTQSHTVTHTVTHIYPAAHTQRCTNWQSHTNSHTHNYSYTHLHIYSHTLSLWHSTMDWVPYKQQAFISNSSGGWESEIRMSAWIGSGEGLVTQVYLESHTVTPRHTFTYPHTLKQTYIHIHTHSWSLMVTLTLLCTHYTPSLTHS